MKLWQSFFYYRKARQGSLDLNHSGMKILIKLGEKANKILDLGCGEGTRLSVITKKNGFGVDISSRAISLAKRSYPKLRFKKMNLRKLTFKDREFDLVYSAFVLEHLENPEEVIREAIRVTASNGNLVFIAPNYGAPNRASPVFSGSRIKKIFNGFIKDLIRPFRKEHRLDWDKVEPVDSVRLYLPDLDAKVEPYLGSLVNFLKKEGLKIREYSSCWQEELPRSKIHQKIFKILAKLGIYPFIFWGPHLLVWAQKREEVK